MGSKDFVMAISAKELMQPPMFEGLGKFVYARPGSGDWPPTYTFEFLGSQVNVEVDESEVANPPAVGTMFHIIGHVRSSQRNGAVSLIATEKRFVASDADKMTEEQMMQYVAGLSITGVGAVKDKQSTTMKRTTYMSATLEWQGSTHLFKKLTPEIVSVIFTSFAAKFLLV